MGDHRAECHIKFTFHGKLYELNLEWVNWTPYEGSIDRRVVEFFDGAYSDGLMRFEENALKRQQSALKERVEAQERADYERLRAKFEPPD